MFAGISTACLYPKPLEESLYDLAVNGVSCTEVFINTHSELKKSFAHEIATILKRFDMKCASVHPFTCEMEQLMFFSDYERRLTDALEYYMNCQPQIGQKLFSRKISFKLNGREITERAVDAKIIEPMNIISEFKF